MVRPTEPGPDLRRAVAGALGTEIVSWRPVSGGFSAAGLWTIATAAGDQWFIKAATTSDTARFLRSEMNLYASLQAPFLPAVEAGGEIDQEHPFVVMEDLSDWHWPPPWDASQINALFKTCSDISSTAVPPGLLSGIDPQLDVDYWHGWQRIRSACTHSVSLPPHGSNVPSRN